MRGSLLHEASQRPFMSLLRPAANADAHAERITTIMKRALLLIPFSPETLTRTRASSASPLRPSRWDAREEK
jgi:hypothetical protein